MDTNPELLRGFDRVLEAGHGYELILLRETELGPPLINRGDVDLLASKSGVRNFARRVGLVCAEEGLSYRIQRENTLKTIITLCSPHLVAGIHFDLWTDLWQIFGGRNSLRFCDVRPACAPASGAVLRMPPALELAIYVQHLSVKRRVLASPTVQSRLLYYAASCRAVGEVEVAGEADRLLHLPSVDEAALRIAERYLRKRLARTHRWLGPSRRIGRCARTLAARRLRLRFADRALALIGVDGAGKSSLAESLAAHVGDGGSRFTSKSLYRKTMVFRVLYGLNWRTWRARRERVDEVVAPLTFVTAAFSLGSRLAELGTGGVTFDRYLPDFLYVRRKTDEPSFSRLAFLGRWFHVAVPVIHLTVPYEILLRRKSEVSRRGLARYDADMAAFYESLPHVDYLRFRNDFPLEQASRILRDYLVSARRLPSPGDGSGQVATGRLPSGSDVLSSG